MSSARATFRRVWQKGLWKLGFRSLTPDRPSTLMVEPTNACNLRCPACPTGAGTLNRPPRAMTLAEFRGILDQALDPPGYLRQVTLFNYGEPFLCRDLLAMVRLCAGRGVRTFTSTNGHFFTSDAVADEIVASGLTELVVCLDGADQETIGRYRRNASFEEIVAGLRRLLGARARAGGRGPRVELQFIVMKHNERQTEAMRRLAGELGVDRFILKTVGIRAGGPSFQRLAEELLPADLSQSRYERRKDGAFALRGDPPRGCEYILSTLVVNSNGDAVPCCYDVDSDFVMGNLFRESLESVWRGERFQEFRRRVRKGRDLPAMCRHCPEGRGTIRKVGAAGGGRSTGAWEGRTHSDRSG